jgi:hypothetical protein
MINAEPKPNSAQRRSLRHMQCGAVMAEAAISIIVFIGLLGLFADIGFSLYRYSRLYRVAQDTVKEYSLQLASSEKPCEELQEEMRTFALNRMRGEFGISGEFQFNPSFSLPDSANGDDIRSVNLEAIWPVNCAICIFTKKMIVKVWAEQPIEAPDFWCST